ncbi:DNA binding domain-containing protein, excisionase family [Sanguibacter gelidistatuariae]|uniref:DNA binding domain-containing protein, excisionase family n=1 Tax=Sanguibacter gelidistatuariae TaxID=1814289 RepID=A0A1G6T596_9MICO|nr:helix-turn-helix domain-containing protein [Sanguibacter gelidistatuariae]SDD23535.1 DNA binding domain-containing protein, excisionase family [Sanguibacter gelidistatuariae]
MITSKSTLRLVTPETAPRAPRPAHRGAEIVTINIQPDDQVLLTVPEAARRLGISRALLYQMIATGEIESVHVHTLRKITPEALTKFVESLRGQDD